MEVVPSKRKGGKPAGRVYGGMPDAQRRAERRERFLEAGIVSFGRDGYAGTTTRSLCAEAGLTQRYFYESFDGIEALFETVVRRLGEELERRLLEAAARAPADPAARLESVLTVYFQAMKRDVHVARILLAEVYTAGKRTGALAFRFTAHLAELLRAQIDHEYPRLAKDGVDTGLMATGLIGATHHVALKWMAGRYAEPVSVVVATAMRIYLGPPAAPKRG
jgi:AcrR family transcriptional regulator